MSANNDDARFAHEPSSQEQLDAKKVETNALEPADNPALSDKQREWEAILRDHLGSFYYPLYLEAKAKGAETAWDYVEEDPALPRMLIIGDSISRGYTLPVRHRLAGEWNVLRAPENCGRTHNAIEKLAVWLGEGAWDRITLNFGIHDRQTPDDEYTRNLEQIVGMLKDTKAELFWVSTTPVPEGALEYVPGAGERVNRLANAVMGEHDIPVIDLCGFITPLLPEYQLEQNCHYKLEGYEAMGDFLTRYFTAK